MTARMLALDLRRGPAPVLLLAVLGAGGALAAGEPGGCSGAWGEAVLSARGTLAVVVPCVLAAAVWHGGDARRRHVDEALAATGLPPGRRALVEGASIAVAGIAAYALLAVALAVTGGCTSGLLGGPATAALGAGAVQIGAAAFAGLAFGRLAAAPMAAPLVLFGGLAVTLTLGGWSEDASWAMLVLPGVDADAALRALGGRAAVAQVLWYAGVGLSGWLWASRRPLAGTVSAVAGLLALTALEP